MRCLKLIWQTVAVMTAWTNPSWWKLATLAEQDFPSGPGIFVAGGRAAIAARYFYGTALYMLAGEDGHCRRRTPAAFRNKGRGGRSPLRNRQRHPRSPSWSQSQPHPPWVVEYLRWGEVTIVTKSVSRNVSRGKAIFLPFLENSSPGEERPLPLFPPGTEALIIRKGAAIAVAGCPHRSRTLVTGTDRLGNSSISIVCKAFFELRTFATRGRAATTARIFLRTAPRVSRGRTSTKRQ